ncbi:hypothetical protein D3C71_2044100 [compost metagenome]
MVTDEDSIKSIAFAHKVDYDKAIFLEQHSLVNISVEEVSKILKENYPDFSIFNDDVFKEDENFEPYDYQLLIANKKNPSKVIF